MSSLKEKMASVFATKKDNESPFLPDQGKLKTNENPFHVLHPVLSKQSVEY